MTLCVMILDMLKLRCFSKGRHIPIQFPQPFMQRRIAGANVSDVAFEMLHVYRIEADDCGVEADVSLCNVFTKIVRCGVLDEMFFGAVECSE